MADLKTNLLGFTMNSPILGASGTVGYGVEYEELADFSKIGGISGKGLTLHGQYGNKGERLWETPSGLINSIGLQNPGVQHFIDVELGEMLELKQKYGTVAIANLGGHSEEEYGSIAGIVRVSTDTGAVGFHGFVTQLYDPADYDVVLVCGPTVMMRNAARLCAEKGTPCFVSLEKKMACGIGACLGCTCETKSGEGKSVCKNGPVFDATEVFF